MIIHLGKAAAEKTCQKDGEGEGSYGTIQGLLMTVHSYLCAVLAMWCVMGFDGVLCSGVMCVYHIHVVFLSTLFKSCGSSTCALLLLLDTNVSALL